MVQPLDSPPNVFMFAGQGSQYFQMGRELFDAGGEFAHWMRYLDRCLQKTAGLSVVAALYGNQKRSEPFVDTLLTHPAIFMLEVALAKELLSRDVHADITLGVSMGSFAAAVIADCLSAEYALDLVVTQAEEFSRHCAKGTMIAILANESLHREEPLRSRSVIASHNFESHFVLSTMAQHCDSIVEFLKGRGVSHQVLPVAFAFHSPWIGGAKRSFEAAVRRLTARSSSIPVACCATATLLADLPAGFFWDAVEKPIRFRDTITALETSGPHRYLDVGAAGTLAGLLRYILPSSSRSAATPILNPFGRDLHNLESVARLFAGGRS